MLYDTLKAIINGAARVFWRAGATGVENVPLEGPLIIACNHVSYLDPPVMGSFVPRRINYMAKAELFQIPVLGALIRAVGAYPVDRQGSAKAAIKRSVEVLQGGGAIGIFPEGTRNAAGNAEPRKGAALLASLTGAPVVPACILGGDRAKRFGQIKVAFGPPLRLPPDRKATQDDLAKFTDQIMRAIRALAESMSADTKG
ncbi:MAG: lysophospholipid acyltransferase family protein [Vulcanimicrobiaceae bacterium]